MPGTCVCCGPLEGGTRHKPDCAFMRAYVRACLRATTRAIQTAPTPEDIEELEGDEADEPIYVPKHD